MELSDYWKSSGVDTEEAKKRYLNFKDSKLYDFRRVELEKMAHEIVKHHMKHNAEVEACDLLIEVERLDMLVDFVEEVDHQRVCHYLIR